MIPLAKLRDIRTIVTHDDCPDGIATAMILRDVLPLAKVVLVKHKTPAFTALKPEPGMLFCDITPDPHADIQGFRDAGTIVLDHHGTAKDLVASFGPLGCFADEKDEPGVSGAYLAYREVWLPLFGAETPSVTMASVAERKAKRTIVEHFATVAGIRDTWQRNNPLWRESCGQAELLKFYPKQTWLQLDSAAPDIFCRRNPSEWEAKMRIADILLARNEEYVKRTLSQVHRFEITKGSKTLRVAVMDGTNTSDVADAASDIDLLIGWAYLSEYHPESGEKLVMVFSCRSRGNFHAGEFVKFFGGGGHSGAAGFRVEVQPTDPNPYTLIRQILTQTPYEMP